MLPEELSNDLCSLNPHTDKLTLTCEMKISGKTGQLVNSKIYKSLINSDFRLTYKDVDNLAESLVLYF
jgi:ribonuclease R